MATQTAQEQVGKWIIEATSGYNDGWVQQHYREQLQDLYNTLNGLSFILKNKNAEKSD
jgi:hypothetical protein